MTNKRKHQRCVLFAALFLLGGCRSQAEAPVADNAVQQSGAALVKAPDFSLVDLEGKKFSLHDYKGKVVFIDFWATWCPPCVISTPEVKKLEDDYRKRGLVVLSLSLDSTDGPVRRFVSDKGIKSRVALVGDEGADSRYGVQGIPSFFLVDKNGNLARAWGGYSSQVAVSWRKEVDKLIGL